VHSRESQALPTAYDALSDWDEHLTFLASITHKGCEIASRGQVAFTVYDRSDARGLACKQHRECAKCRIGTQPVWAAVLFGNHGSRVYAGDTPLLKQP
jgi:hypothetical protein